MSELEFNKVSYGRQQFEKLHCTIYKFTTDFLHRNQERPLPANRQEVNWHWEQQIMKAYPKNNDPMRVLLLEQESCPLIEVFWEKQADEEAFKKKRAEQRESGFYLISRDRTAAEYKKHRYAVIMTHVVYGDVIVPEILLRPLHRISYLELIRKILIANPTKNLELSVLYELWDAILNKVYDYEYKWREHKQLEGVTATNHKYDEIVADISQSKKRQHSEVEEGSGNSDAPMAKIKQAKSSAKPTKVSKASGCLDTTQTTIKTEVPAKVPRAAKNSGILNTPSSMTEADIPGIAIKAEDSDQILSDAASSIVSPHPTRPANAAPAVAPTTGPNTAQPSSRRRVQPPPPSQASETHHSNNGEADRLSRGVAPWPYDPNTGEKTNGATEYRLSAREWTMLRNGIPPWPYDPKTGVKTKITTGYSLR